MSRTVPVHLTPAHWTLSRWLAARTDIARNAIVECIDTHQPTGTDHSCHVLLTAHLHFYNLVSPVYNDTNLKSMFCSFLTGREIDSFALQLRSEMQLNIESGKVVSRIPRGLIPRVGWLYATEFVDRGITRLLAGACPSYTGLNVDAEASASMWAKFRNNLDGLDFSETDEERLARSACCALFSYSNIFNIAFKVVDDLPSERLASS